MLINGNVYEYGPHIFHTTDPEVLADVQRIAGHVLIPFHKTIKIKFLGKYFAFPLAIRDVIFKLPVRTVAHAALSFAWHFVSGGVAGERGMVNSEKVLQRYYGDVLYRIFGRDLSMGKGQGLLGMLELVQHDARRELDARRRLAGGL